MPAAGLSSTQASVVNALLGVCKQLNAPKVCWAAILYAATYETNLGENSDTFAVNSAGATGVLQGTDPHWKINPRDIAGQAQAFLQGGFGFQAGGAITLARQGVTDPIEIAVKVEVPSIWPANAYAAEGGYPGDVAALGKVNAIMAAFGGGVLPGGVAGLGGSGTAANSAPQNTYSFQVGSTDNPDEDNFTAANRLAQEVNWYLFSDGETVYYLDGADLIAQDPGPNARLDRVRDVARIKSLRITYDNTAFQYTSTHKRKGKVQHKTRLSQVVSPTSCTLELFCGIDEFRAGDLIVLSSCGPVDGRWVIGDARRSVFETFTSMTLVPPVAPIAEAQAAGTTGKAKAAGAGAGTPTGKSGNYVSPFAKKYTAGLANTDQGVDFGRQQGISTGDPIMAIGDCYCRSTAQFYVGSSNPQALWFELVDKSGGYWGWYVAEEMDPKVGAGPQLIKAGTVVATYAASGTGIEIGWAAGPGETATRAFHPSEIATRHAGYGTTDGRNFLTFLQRVGAV